MSPVDGARATDEERVARAALSRLGEPGDPRLTALTTQLGPLSLLRALQDHTELEVARPSAASPTVTDDLALRLARIDGAAELERAASRGIRFVVPGDAEWPPGLGDLAGMPAIQDRSGVPIGLWVRGPVGLDRLAGSVGVVGSRAATTYGCEVAREIAAQSARSGLVVVSGAAMGIDQSAHRGAVAMRGPTAAVLAGGVDRAYPAANREMIDYIAGTGCVVSEAAPGTAPARLRFLARNRLIAAMTRGTVVVEAALRSGALNTAHWADQLSRVLMGVPGPVTSGPSQGVHQLIRRGAALVTGGTEVLELLGVSGDDLLEEPRGPSRSRDTLSLRQRQILDAVPVERPAPTDSIAATAGVGLMETHDSLGRLEPRGFVRSTEAGWVLGPRAG